MKLEFYPRELFSQRLVESDNQEFNSPSRSSFSSSLRFSSLGAAATTTGGGGILATDWGGGGIFVAACGGGGILATD